MDAIGYSNETPTLRSTNKWGLVCFLGFTER
jgi:hypothetical protein